MRAAAPVRAAAATRRTRSGSPDWADGIVSGQEGPEAASRRHRGCRGLRFPRGSGAPLASAWRPCGSPGATSPRSRARCSSVRVARASTPHHHPLPVEGRPQPTCLRSVARTARKPPRPARKRHSRPCPPLRLCIAPRLGPASSAYVLLPAQVSRLRRLTFAAVAHSGYAVCPSRRCAYTAYALGMACWEFDVRRAGRFLAAARTPLRQMGCCSFALVRGWWWGVAFGYSYRREFTIAFEGRGSHMVTV